MIIEYIFIIATDSVNNICFLVGMWECYVKSALYKGLKLQLHRNDSTWVVIDK